MLFHPNDIEDIKAESSILLDAVIAGRQDEFREQVRRSVGYARYRYEGQWPSARKYHTRDKFQTWNLETRLKILSPNSYYATNYLVRCFYCRGCLGVSVNNPIKPADKEPYRVHGYECAIRFIMIDDSVFRVTMKNTRTRPIYKAELGRVMLPQRSDYSEAKFADPSELLTYHQFNQKMMSEPPVGYTHKFDVAI